MELLTCPWEKDTRLRRPLPTVLRGHWQQAPVHQLVHGWKHPLSPRKPGAHGGSSPLHPKHAV